MPRGGKGGRGGGRGAPAASPAPPSSKGTAVAVAAKPEVQSQVLPSKEQVCDLLLRARFGFLILDQTMFKNIVRLYEARQYKRYPFSVCWFGFSNFIEGA